MASRALVLAAGAAAMVAGGADAGAYGNNTKHTDCFGHHPKVVWYKPYTWRYAKYFGYKGECYRAENLPLEVAAANYVGIQRVKSQGLESFVVPENANNMQLQFERLCTCQCFVQDLSIGCVSYGLDENGTSLFNFPRASDFASPPFAIPGWLVGDERLGTPLPWLYLYTPLDEGHGAKFNKYTGAVSFVNNKVVDGDVLNGTFPWSKIIGNNRRRLQNVVIDPNSVPASNQPNALEFQNVYQGMVEMHIPGQAVETIMTASQVDYISGIYPGELPQPAANFYDRSFQVQSPYVQEIDLGKVVCGSDALASACSNICDESVALGYTTRNQFSQKCL